MERGREKEWKEEKIPSFMRGGIAGSHTNISCRLAHPLKRADSVALYTNEDNATIMLKEEG